MKKARGMAIKLMSPISDSGGNGMAEVSTERKPSLSTKKGSTRGRNPRPVEYQAFDLEKPNTLPVTQAEFMEVTGVKEQSEIVALLIDGFNSAAYSLASDEIGEFINDAWDKETQTQFRAAVRNYSKLVGSSVEDAVLLIKPGVEKAFNTRKLAANVAA